MSKLFDRLSIWSKNASDYFNKDKSSPIRWKFRMLDFKLNVIIVMCIIIILFLLKVI